MRQKPVQSDSKEEHSESGSCWDHLDPYTNNLGVGAELHVIILTLFGIEAVLWQKDPARTSSGKGLREGHFGLKAYCNYAAHRPLKIM